ncbi:MAG TPA: hypothetical protein VGO61_01415 [Steroidobacteraceae bacterium]|jgi:hypothetical protein|nr:hypothetical protein [Steroidobacteraceae bacterium]
MKESVRLLWLRWTLVRVVLGAVFAVSTGCDGTVERAWSEEVQLDDGSVLVVDRYVKFKESNSLAGDAYSSTSIKSTLAFTGEQSGFPEWDVPLTPIVLYRDAVRNEWVVVSTTSNCDTWYARDKPIPPYWEFRLRNGKWSASQLSHESIGRKANLFFRYESALPAKKIGVDLKTKILASSDFAAKYRSVVADLKSRCGY